MASTAASTPTYHDALSLDVHTLSLLLQRNHDQHRRCVYFRRLSMVMSAIRRLPSIEEMNEWMDQWKGLVQLLLDECEGSKDGDEPNSHSLKRREKEEKWTLEMDGDRAFKIISHNDNDNLQQLQQMPSLLQRLKTLATQSIPQIISRVIHATSPILCEISRGYFVPFLTVALACLGRIHTLLLRMGRELVIVLQEMVPKVRVIFEKEKRAKCVKDVMDWKTLEDLIMPTFFVGVKKHGKQGASKNTKTAELTEWKDLMTQFLEVSQDDLTKQTNEFVKDRRWEDAMSRVGLSTSVSGSNTSKLPVKQLGSNEEHEYTGECDCLLSNDENGAQPFAGNDKTNEDMYNDTGEPVNNMPTCDFTTKNNVAPRDAVDDNMVRIMQKDRERRLATTPASESPVPRKKRRKKKREKHATADQTRVDNERRLQNHTDRATVDDGMDSREMTFLNSANPEGEEAHSMKGKQSNSVLADDKNKASAVVQPDPIRTEEYSDVVKQKQKKKKSSKKAKKQKRKSTSVIDDIFGP